MNFGILIVVHWLRVSRNWLLRCWPRELPPQVVDDDPEVDVDDGQDDREDLVFISPTKFRARLF